MMLSVMRSVLTLAPQHGHSLSILVSPMRGFLGRQARPASSPPLQHSFYRPSDRQEVDAVESEVSPVTGVLLGHGLLHLAFPLGLMMMNPCS